MPHRPPLGHRGDREARVHADDSEVRLKLTEWTGKHETQVRETHVLLRSKLIAMGMAVANLALGGHLRTYTSRTAFDAARVRMR